MISTFRVNDSGTVNQHIISDVEVIKGHQWNRQTSMALVFGAFGARRALPPTQTDDLFII